MKKLIISLHVLFICSFVQAQDIHFSQFYAAPLYYNPANTGNFIGSARIGLNYKDQWGSVTVPYRSYDVYSDIGIQPGKSTSRFGLGLLALNDVAGDGILTTSKLQASAAYHINYTENATWRLSFGLSGSYVQKMLDINLLTFDNQWNVDEFDHSLLNNETSAMERINYYDFSSGAVATYIPYEGERYYLGFAAHHINKPDESFLGEANKVHIKYAVQAGAFIQLNNGASLQPQLFYTQQSSASEIIGGANLSVRTQFYNREKYRAYILGAWYRYKDAAWLVAGMNMGKFTCTVNYDFNFSQLTPASTARGGLEIAMVYVFGRSDKHDPTNCPAFE